MMKFICTETEREAGICAAEIMAEVINSRPDAVIGLATGSTPLNMYSELVRMYREGSISFKGVRSVNLDEYVGLAPTHNQSYAYFMSKNLFDNIDIMPENTHLPSGIATDPSIECERYDRLLDRIGRVDIQLLGIGHNGHIAFNEPDTHFPKDTTLVSLTDSTVSANSRFFESMESVPKQAISMGIGRILRAKRILLLATGRGKADILEKALFGRITPDVPASILQFYQGELTVVCDSEAFATIKEKHPDLS
jgi:glucosamine-6-phosphate deaminase